MPASIIDASNADTICKIADFDERYTAIKNQWFEVRQAHTLMSVLGGFIISSNGESMALHQGQSMDFPAMAPYTITCGDVQPISVTMSAVLTAKAEQEAAYANKHHPSGKTFEPRMINPTGGRVIAIARRPKHPA